tara:strand:+ start:1500 stop:3809 length:2310 start_codon:yes stop_codon:yes gene_type:complete
VQHKLIKDSYKFLFILIISKSLNVFAIDQGNSFNNQDYFRGCNNPDYPKLNNTHKSGSLNAGVMNIQSNGDISLDENVLIAIDNGSIKASSATYLQDQDKVQDIKNGNIYHSTNYFKFLSGSLEKESGEIELGSGTTYLRERNLLINYGSLTGNLGKSLEFKNANLSSCNNDSRGWKIEAKTININEETSRGYIEDLNLKILNRTILKLPYLPFPATTKRLSGFLEPEFSITSDGVDIFLPYFWVMSKKSDLTIAPRIVKDRGAGLEGNYRYRTKSNLESVNFFDALFFSNDKEFKKDHVTNDNDRWAFRLKESRNFSAFTTSIDWAKSSDPMVLLDLPSSLTKIANQRDHYLTQSVSINMLLDNFSINIMREGFQSLNPFINNGYIKKPVVNIEYRKYGNKLSYFAKADYTDFDIDTSKRLLFDDSQTNTTGKRFVTEIGAETLHKHKYFNISINGSLLHKKYSLDDVNLKTSSSSIPTVKMQISSLFRKSSKSGLSLIAPELIYRKTNFKDQSMDPIFDLHQRNFGSLSAHNKKYFFGNDRVPDTEFLTAKLKWQKRMKDNERLNFQIFKRHELKASRIIDLMLKRPLGKDSQIGTNLSFENNSLKTYIAANYSQKRNALNFGQTGIEIKLPETQLTLSRNFHRNIPLLNTTNELDYAEFTIERLISGGYRFIGGISKDLDLNKNLESYLGFGFENCCLAFKIYASDKRLSKYNLLNFQSPYFNNSSWERMISIENKSRINFEFELKGLTSGNKKINRFFSNAFSNL